MSVTNCPNFPVSQFKSDYDTLPVGDTMHFIYFSASYPHRFSMWFSEAWIDRGIDYSMRIYPVMAPEAIPILGEANQVQLNKFEFFAYADRLGKLEADPNNCPTVYAIESSIQRRSNRSFLSDTLPRIQHAYQISISKLTDKTFKR